METRFPLLFYHSKTSGDKQGLIQTPPPPEPASSSQMLPRGPAPRARPDLSPLIHQPSADRSAEASAVSDGRLYEAIRVQLLLSAADLQVFVGAIRVFNEGDL